MTATHAATLAHLNTLRADSNAALRVMERASQNGTFEDWRTAHAAAKIVCEKERIERERVIAAGFEGDVDFEFAVLGRLTRRHERSSMTTQEVRAALYGA